MTAVRMIASAAGLWFLALNVFAGAALDPAKPDGGNAEWRLRHGERVADVKSHSNNLDVLFIGDSITAGWCDIGKAIWEKQFVPLHAVNIGIAGSQTSHILWQFENGAIDGINPRVAVLMIGVNNVTGEGYQSAADIARGISTIVARLREKLPNTRVLLLGTFPKDRAPGTPDRRKIQDINALIAKLDDGKWIRFLNISGRLLDEDGNLTADVSPDGVHLTEKGYGIWAEAILPVVREMMAATSPQQDAPVQSASTFLSDLKPGVVKGEWRADRNFADKGLTVGDVQYSRGVCIKAGSELTYQLDGKYKWLDSWVGLDASAANGSVVFKVFCDDELAFDSGVFSDTDHPPTGASRFNRNRAVACRVPLESVRQLRLAVTGTGGEAANWAEARLWTGSIPLQDANRFGPADGVARTPPMGYCTWNSFIFDFDEKVIRELADAMVSSGMKDAGYEYLMVDEPGFRTRDKDGNLVPDPKKYPGGMKALGDYLHARGLKLGIYTDAKSVTCGGFLGSYGHFEQDARLFASWGVDYVKADWNDAPDPEPAPKVYADLAAALRATGRPIYFAVIHWGMGSHHWARKAGSHTWRTTFDVLNAWDTPADSNTGVGCLKAADQTEALGVFAGPGGWNDPDMLTVGMQQQEKKYQATYNGKQLPIKTVVEDRSHFSLWCLLNAPLLAGNDLRTMPAGVRDILTNRELIALNQDPLGIPAWRAQKMGDLEVWKKPLKNGDIAVGLFNRSDRPQRMTASWRYLDISGKWKARDLWAHKDLGEFEGGYSCEPAGHEMVVLRFSRIPDPTPAQLPSGGQK